MPDHGSGDYDPVFPAGRLLCLRFSCNRLLCLHHPGGAFCTQGALTRYRHPQKPPHAAAVKSKVKRARLRVFSESGLQRAAQGSEKLRKLTALPFQNKSGSAVMSAVGWDFVFF